VMDERQRISLEEALEAYTESGAFSQKQEHRKGRLVPGQLADITVFSRNLFAASLEDILSGTRVDLTVVDGRLVYRA
jgi:predicted amidohydrolase YtcJ